MRKRQIFILGLLGTLGMLSFIIGVWNGIELRTKRKPRIVGYQIEDRIEIQNVEYLSANRNSRGKSNSKCQPDVSLILPCLHFY